MENTVLIDTNLYLDDADIIYKLSSDFNKILIPITVLKELDKKKYEKDLSYSARNAIKAILNFSANNPEKIIFDTQKYGQPDADDRILTSAKAHKAVVATKDVNMSITARSFGLKSMLHEVVTSSIFDPYLHLHMDELQEMVEKENFSYGQEYIAEDYQKITTVFSTLSENRFSKENWWFVIIDVNTKFPIIYANHPIDCKLVRIDDKPIYREIRTEGSNIKARDCYQICAIYAMLEAPNTLICGSYGSGKSLLASAYAISYNTDRKTFISRPNLTVDKRFSLGFLPGSLEEKLNPWMAGFISSLYHIFSNTKGQITEKAPRLDNTYDFVKDTIFTKYFEMVPLDSLQGTSFMNGDLLLLDEAQLCSIPVLATILSRFGEGSKLVMTGDIQQTYGVISPSENGLLKLLRLLPNNNLAYVVLKNNYRSNLLELANKLQNKVL